MTFKGTKKQMHRLFIYDMLKKVLIHSRRTQYCSFCYELRLISFMSTGFVYDSLLGHCLNLANARTRDVMAGKLR